MLTVCERIVHLSSSDTAVMHQGFSNLQHFLLNILDLFEFYASLKQYRFSDQCMALVQESFIQIEKKFCGNINYRLLNPLNMSISFWQHTITI